MNRRLALLGLLWLGACASRSPQSTSMPFWSGRIALLVQGEPPQQLHGLFELQGSAQEGELRLLSPVGTLLARLSWDARLALLERGNERQSAPTVEELAQRLTRTAFPVQALFDWLQGQPVNHAGWEPDLGAHAQGRISARRIHPEPVAQLRIVLDR